MASEGRSNSAVMNSLLHGAFREAESLGHDWIGPEHYFLAILSLGEEPLTVALGELGIEHAAFARGMRGSHAEYSTRDAPAPARSTEMTLNAAAHELIGRADGIARCLGTSSIAVEHVLAAFLWDSAAAGELEAFCNVSSAAVLERLSQVGVQTPAVLHQDTAVGARVFIPYSVRGAVYGELRRRLPSDSGLGVNNDGQHAWVMARRDVDLAAHVRTILTDMGIDEIETRVDVV